MVGMYIIIPIVTFIIGGLLAWLGMRFLLKSKYDSVLQEAEKEAEVAETQAKEEEQYTLFPRLKERIGQAGGSGLGKTGITA